MNTSNNRRYQETEQKIKDAFLHLLDSGKRMEQISVQDICRMARISRPSFYTHYEDINEMVLKTEREKAEQIQAILMREAVPTAGIFETYFDYLKDNRSFYMAYFSSGENAYSQSLMDAYFREHQTDYQDSGMDAESVKYLMTFFSAGLKAVAYRWLKGGCKETSFAMAAFIHRTYFSGHSK